MTGLGAQWARLPDLLSAHMLLTVSALLAGAAISLPLGVICARSNALRGPALTFASIVQTVPALALLALMVPLMGRIGFWPAFAALLLYSILPMLRNTIVGLDGVDPAAREAARAVGMTPVQALRRVELPLAAPAILAGVRTATVWVVGAATLSTPVGAPSLGDYIFSGLQTRNWAAVIFGCVFSAALAIVLDQILRAVETGLADRKPRRSQIAGLLFALIVGAALVPGLVERNGGVTGQSAARSAQDEAAAPGIEGRRIVVGAKGFTEQYILAALIADRLEAAGADPVIRGNLGSTVAFDALRQGNVDIYVEYTGTLWASIMNENAPVRRDEMAVRTAAWLLQEHQILQLGGLGFENAYGFAVTEARAEAESLRTIGDLAALDPLSIGADPEFFARPEWTRTREAYGLSGARARSMDSTFMYGAVRDGAVDAVTAYTTDGRVAAFDLAILDDPMQVLPPYDAVLLLSPEASDNPALIAALRPLLSAVPPGLMREANRRVDIDGASPAQAARWLDERIAARREPPAQAGR